MVGSHLFIELPVSELGYGDNALRQLQLQEVQIFGYNYDFFDVERNPMNVPSLIRPTKYSAHCADTGTKYSTIEALHSDEVRLHGSATMSTVEGLAFLPAYCDDFSEHSLCATDGDPERQADARVPWWQLEISGVEGLPRRVTRVEISFPCAALMFTAGDGSEIATGSDCDAAAEAAFNRPNAHVTIGVSNFTCQTGPLGCHLYDAVTGAARADVYPSDSQGERFLGAGPELQAALSGAGARWGEWQALGHEVAPRSNWMHKNVPAATGGVGTADSFLGTAYMRATAREKARRRESDTGNFLPAVKVVHCATKVILDKQAVAAQQRTLQSGQHSVKTISVSCPPAAVGKYFFIELPVRDVTKGSSLTSDRRQLKMSEVRVFGEARGCIVPHPAGDNVRERSQDPPRELLGPVRPSLSPYSGDRSSPFGDISHWNTAKTQSFKRTFRKPAYGAVLPALDRWSLASATSLQAVYSFHRGTWNGDENFRYWNLQDVPASGLTLYMAF